MNFLKVYEREPVKRSYVPSLAESVHFALSRGGGEMVPLNSNVGVLYASAEISEHGTILERRLREPRIYRQGGEYRVAAKYVDGDGDEPHPEMLYVWSTRDFRRFDEVGLVTCADVPDASDAVEISDGEADMIEAALPTVRSEAPAPFPMIEGFADPDVMARNGRYYFIATNDRTGNVGLYASAADTVEGLFARENEPVCILPESDEWDMHSTFWAPEFHEIGGELYVLFAVGGRQFSPQSHMMRYRGGNILDPSSWERPVRVQKKNGEPLTARGITLDMTHFALGGRSYLVWSERYNIGSPEDSGSMLYIAETDAGRPWRLKKEPVLLSRPLYSWENQSGTINNEGPHPLFAGEKLCLSFSGGAAGGYSYSTGWLVIDTDADPLNAANWYKVPYPALASQYVNGVEGPGHISFFRTYEGEVMMAYHAQLPGRNGKRASSVSRVHIAECALPRLYPLT